MTAKHDKCTVSASIDVSQLVNFEPAPFGAYWRVHGGERKFNGKIGINIGILRIANARAHAIVLQFEDGSVGAFHPMDMFPEVELNASLKRA